MFVKVVGGFSSHKGYFFLSQRIFFSLTERTEFTEVFGAHFEPTEGLRHTENTEASPPAPLRMERGVICEVTPMGLLAYFVEVFLSQSAQSSRRFLAHISSSQNAFGIQSSQSVSAKDGCDVCERGE